MDFLSNWYKPNANQYSINSNNNNNNYYCKGSYEFLNKNSSKNIYYNLNNLHQNPKARSIYQSNFQVKLEEPNPFISQPKALLQNYRTQNSYLNEHFTAQNGKNRIKYTESIYYNHDCNSYSNNVGYGFHDNYSFNSSFQDMSAIYERHKFSAQTKSKIQNRVPSNPRTPNCFSNIRTRNNASKVGSIERLNDSVFKRDSSQNNDFDNHTQNMFINKTPFDIYNKFNENSRKVKELHIGEKQVSNKKFVQSAKISPITINNLHGRSISVSSTSISTYSSSSESLISIGKIVQNTDRYSEETKIRNNNRKTQDSSNKTDPYTTKPNFYSIKPSTKTSNQKIEPDDGKKNLNDKTKQQIGPIFRPPNTDELMKPTLRGQPEGFTEIFNNLSCEYLSKDVEMKKLTSDPRRNIKPDINTIERNFLQLNFNNKKSLYSSEINLFSIPTKANELSQSLKTLDNDEKKKNLILGDKFIIREKLNTTIGKTINPSIQQKNQMITENINKLSSKAKKVDDNVEKKPKVKIIETKNISRPPAPIVKKIIISCNSLNENANRKLETFNITEKKEIAKEEIRKLNGNQEPNSLNYTKKTNNGTCEPPSKTVEVKNVNESDLNKSNDYFRLEENNEPSKIYFKFPKLAEKNKSNYEKTIGTVGSILDVPLPSENDAFSEYSTFVTNIFTK
ncbi:unnamed protein product [Brachionus calyciflorus]|uniref:Uncharacterized protein n=1 Tax=Brachionus calyciflorus TaxID=104777 RepID=A0A813M3Y0_9BILA|nr:unnamed protein product [Brachionus calyciflorus]